MKFKIIKRAFVWGMAVWSAMFVAAFVFVAHEVIDSLVSTITIMLIGPVFAWVAADYIEPINFNQAAVAGLLMAAVGIILDWLVSPRLDPNMLRSAFHWLGYALVVIAPILTINKGVIQTA